MGFSVDTAADNVAIEQAVTIFPNCYILDIYLR